MKIKTALFIPDSHVPFEDPRAFKILYDIASVLKIDTVVILGDFLDMYGLSLYDKDPSFGDLSELYMREIECGIQRLEELKEVTGGAPFHYLEGNHEYRLKKYMVKNCPALRDRLSIPKELELERIGKIQWHPFHRLQSVRVFDSDLYASHCPPVGGQPLNVAKQSGTSVIYGHTHQESLDTFVCKSNGKKQVAHNGGCLIDMDSKVFDYVPNRPNWSQAFTVGHFYRGDFWLETIRINDARAVFRGDVYEA